jgi:hypothetical protein
MLRPAWIKTGLTGLLFLLLLQNLAAFNFGMKAGSHFTFSRFNTNPETWENKPSWQASLFWVIPATPRLDLTMELQLASQKARLRGTTESLNVEWALYRTFLHIPLQFKWKPLGHHEGWQPFIALGPHLTVAMNTRLILTVDNTELEIDFKDYLHRYDVGATISLGVEIPLVGGENVFSFELRYGQGFINQINHAQLETGTLKTGSLMLMAGISF